MSLDFFAAFCLQSIIAEGVAKVITRYQSPKNGCSDLICQKLQKFEMKNMCHISQ